MPIIHSAAAAGLLSVARRWRQRWDDDRWRARHHLAFVPSNRNGCVPFALATAGVCDCSDLVSCASAAVAASTNTNAVASLDMTGFSSCARDQRAAIQLSLGHRWGETGRQDGDHLVGRPRYGSVAVRRDRLFSTRNSFEQFQWFSWCEHWVQIAEGTLTSPNRRYAATNRWDGHAAARVQPGRVTSIPQDGTILLDRRHVVAPNLR